MKEVERENTEVAFDYAVRAFIILPDQHDSVRSPQGNELRIY